MLLKHNHIVGVNTTVDTRERALSTSAYHRDYRISLLIYVTNGMRGIKYALIQHGRAH